MKIGISTRLSKGKSPFVNGLGQNALFLYDTLVNCKSVSEVFLVDFGNSSNIEEIRSISYLKGYKIKSWEVAVKEIDVFISMGIMPSEQDLNYFKSREGTKVIGYKGGNNLILSTEDLLFEKKWGQRKKQVQKSIAYPGNREMYDAIWMVPQQEFHNKDYYEISFGCEATTVPFIWSPMFLDWMINIEKQIHGDDFKILFHEKDFTQWRVASMEPNTSILKNMVPIIHSMEWAYLHNKDAFRQFNITNANEFLSHPILQEIVTKLDMHKDKKIGFDPRWNVVVLLSKYAEMIISHQWGNPLNYAYLDVVYLGYPLVHNAHLCQDIGYYYEGFNLKQAGNLINQVTFSHKNDKSYMTRHREVLKRYLPTNDKVINQYDLLLRKAYDSKVECGSKYDWKTNLLL